MSSYIQLLFALYFFLFLFFFFLFFFFFNDTATTEIYTLSLHDALPIWRWRTFLSVSLGARGPDGRRSQRGDRSEEHTSELQSLAYLVCRLLLEKKKKNKNKKTKQPKHKKKKNQTHTQTNTQNTDTYIPI